MGRLIAVVVVLVIGGEVVAGEPAARFRLAAGADAPTPLVEPPPSATEEGVGCAPNGPVRGSCVRRVYDWLSFRPSGGLPLFTPNPYPTRLPAFPCR